MLVQPKPPVHLTYCLNIHPGETWPEVLAAIRDYATKIRARVAGDEPFGLGLRLSAQATEDLSQADHIESLAAVLAEHNFYVFTVNGFPYGRFHDGPVKEKVYQPDWTKRERGDYTRQIASVLAGVVPRGKSGSISTVPLGGPGRLDAAGEKLAIAQLVNVVAHLEELSFRRDLDLHIGLEPEPGCHLETTSQTIDFVKKFWREGTPLLMSRLGMHHAKAEEVIRKRLGVCLDTCHVALQFEELASAWDRYQAEGVRISKVQISAALACAPTDEAKKALQAFVEPVYLHQTHAQRADKSLGRWVDLPDALRAWDDLAEAKEVRVHFHVPLFWEGKGARRSTASQMTPEFWRRIRDGGCEHVEIETYTFDVLPPALRSASVVDNVVREFEWVRARLGGS